MGVISLDLQQTDAGYDVKKEIERLDKEIDDEVAARVAADTSIWEEIETIEAASDVVDVVGTHEALENYDTSKLQDNDLIKVLQDETRDDAITYYRWNKASSAFAYVGSEGPYYTASETDTLLAAKQDTLVAGTNIQIAADGKTISATDTTYTHFTGATASTDGVQGLVPGPLAGDQNKVLKGDGTWGTLNDTVKTIYAKSLIDGQFDGFYSDAAKTTKIWGYDIINMLKESPVVVDCSGGGEYHVYDIICVSDGDEGLTSFYVCGDSSEYRVEVSTNQQSVPIIASTRVEIQPKLTAGSNITISNNTISATDTTYSNFVGTDGTTAGAAGLVPAPAVADDDKYLKSDGTWATVQSGGTTTMFYSQDNVLYKDSARTVAATGREVVDACDTGDVVIEMSQYDNSAMKRLHVVSYVDGGNWVAIVAVSYYRNMDGDPMTIDWHYTNANSTTAAYHRYTQLQKTLTAGSNITISGSTISARDTTYSAFGGATSQVAGSAGLVPAPAIGDDTKYLKGDGTWATVQSSRPTTMFYVDIIDLTTYTATTIDLYTDDTLSTSITPSQLAAAYAAGPVIINCAHNQVSYGFLYVVGRVENQDSSGNFDYTVVSYLETNDGQGHATAQPNAFVITADEHLDSAPMGLQVFRMQGKLTAGSNISISSANVISVTGMPALYTTTGQNTDGAVTQKLFTDTVGNIESALQILNSGAGVP